MQMLQLTLLVAKVSAVAYFQLATDPVTVQSRGAQITTSFALNKPVPAGGWLRLAFPEDVMTVASPRACTEVNGNLVFTSCTANAAENFIELTLGGPIELVGLSSANYQVTLDNAVNLPMTNAIVDPIQLATSGNEVLQQTFRAVRGDLVASLDPESNIVGADTALGFSVTATHAIPNDGKLLLQVSAPWNEGSPGMPVSYFSSVGCTDLTIGQAVSDQDSYQCTFIDDVLELEGGFPNGVPAGAQISLRIIGFRNPTLGNKDYNVFTALSTGAEVEDLVDTVELGVRVTEPASLSLGVFKVDPDQTTNVGVIQESNLMQVEYVSPVPLQPNCEVSYWFPSAFYDAASIEKVTTGDLLGSSIKDYYPGDEPTFDTFVLASEEDGAYKSITLKACQTYRSSDPREITSFVGLRQPPSTEPTLTLKVYIRDYLGEMTVQLESGLRFVPVAGDLRYSTVSVNPTTVQADSEIEVQFSAEHKLLLDRDASVSIKFPEDFTVPSSCEANYKDEVADCTADQIDNSVTVSGFLNEEYPGDYEILTFRISPIKLPEGTDGGAGNFEISTYLDGYTVDAGQGTGGVILTPGTFQAAQVTTDSLLALDKTDYQIQFQPQHSVPKFGIIRIEYPPEVEIADPSLSQSLCRDWEQFSSDSPICSVYAANRTIMISKGFQAGEGAEDATYSFKIPFVTNPIGLEETQTFRFTTYTGNWGMIDTFDGPVTVQMLNAAVLRTYILDQSSSQNSMPDQLSFSLVSAVPFTDEIVVEISLPEDVEIQDVCSATTDLPQAQSLSCTKSEEGQVIVTIKLNRSVAALQEFTLNLGGVNNPSTTKPSGGISMRVFDDGANNLLTESGNDLRVVTYVPYDIDASLEASRTGAGLVAEYTLEFAIEHDLSPDSGIMITYPPEVELAEGMEITVKVDGSQYGDDLSDAVPVIDKSARQILFQHLFEDGLVADEESRLVVTINGLKNPLNNRKSSSFEFTSFNEEENILYLVDQVVSGLTLEPLCNFPCSTCLEGQPDLCLSCFPDSVLPTLQGGTCLKACSVDYFFDLSANMCLECDPKCLTCAGASDHCITCGGLDYPLLKGSTCVADCGPGYIDDARNNICIACKEGCTSCSVSADNCTSCDLGSSTPALFAGSCHESCPLRISIPDRDIVTCLPCDEKCDTCAGRPNVCTSCPEFMIFDAQRLDCTQSCETGAQIYNEAMGTCESCQFNCRTCVDDVNYCTACKEGFLLNLDNACRTECEGPAGQTIVDGICKVCQEQCETCGERTDQCLTCNGEMLLYQETCVDVCPDLYEPNGEVPNRCIMVGLQCPLGFEVNSGGDGCVPTVFECEEGYEINPAGTACVPVPGTPIPFPFLFLSICCGIVVAGSYMKEKESTKVKTCLIWMIAAMEPLEYALLATYALELGQDAAAIFAGGGLGAMVLINLGYYCYLRSILNADPEYVEWCRLFPRGACFLPFFGLWNMKCARFIYSGFFSWDIAEARFTEKIAVKTIHTSLKMTTYVSNVFVYGPELVSAVFIMLHVEWGHQVYILAIEVIILQLLIVWLTHYEFRTEPLWDLYRALDKEYLALKPRKKGGPMVMSMFEDVEEVDEEHLVRKEKSLQPRESQLRRLVLQGIIKQVGGEFLERENVNRVMNKTSDPRKLGRSDSCENFGRMADFTTELNESADSENLEDYPLVRRASYPSLELVVRDQDFVDEVSRIREAFQERYQNNCYAEARPPAPENAHNRKKKQLSRRTQTYLRELLWIPGEATMEADQKLVLDESPELDNLFAPNLVAGVLDRLSMSSVEDVPKKLPREPSMPEFELEEIMGEFDLDDEGNYVIMEGPDGLVDKKNRPVNRRGYLSDPKGNVVTKFGRVVFKAKDLDSDDEIPAKFVFEKRKANLVTIEQQDQMMIHDFGHGAGDEDDKMTALHADDVTDQNIDDLLNLITKKVVPEKQQTFHNFNVNSSKESKAAESQRLLKGEAEAHQLAHAIGNMANQLAESQSQQPRYVDGMSSRRTEQYGHASGSGSMEFGHYADHLARRPDHQKKEARTQGKSRIFSGDPRLRDLEVIYTNAKVPGQANKNRPKTAEKHQMEMPTQYVQKTLVADTLDRLQNDPNFDKVDLTSHIGSGLRQQASQELIQRGLNESTDKGD